MLNPRGISDLYVPSSREEQGCLSFSDLYEDLFSLFHSRLRQLHFVMTNHYLKSAIISQLSSTTLQIPALSSINWTASAFIITGLLFSILATMLSCIQQQVLGTLNEPGGVRMWLSNGSSSRSGSKHGKGGHPFTRSQDRDGMQTSVAALLLLRLPNAFLLYGVTCFLLGFGLFLGFAWRQDLDNTPSRDNNMAVMIMYIAVGGVSVLGTAGVVKWKMGEVDQAEKIVGKDLEEGDNEEDGDGSENGSKAGNQQEDSGSEGEADGLLAKTKRNGKYSPREAINHERIAKALEDAARAHRELAKLMNNAIQDRQDD
jgi:hypothetical protein